MLLLDVLQPSQMWYIANPLYYLAAELGKGSGAVADAADMACGFHLL